MKREQIYVVLGVVAVLLTIGGVYQFYFSNLLDQYSQNIARREQLRTRLLELAGPDGFDGYRPASLVSAWRGYIQPWTDALQARAAYFNVEDVAVDPVPEGKIPKFHYAEEFNKRVLALQTYAYTRNPPCQIPADLFGYFGAPTPDSIVTRSVTSQQVVDWLRQFENGARLLRLFIDAGAEAIQEFQIWPARRQFEDMVDMHTVGVQLTIRMEKLAQFIDDLQRANRYFSVDALSIQNSDLLTYYDPPLQVGLLVTQAQLPPEIVRQVTASGDGSPAEGAAAAGVSATSGKSLLELMREMQASAGGTVAPVRRESGFSRWWKDFRRQWLPF